MFSHPLHGGPPSPPTTHDRPPPPGPSYFQPHSAQPQPAHPTSLSSGLPFPLPAPSRPGPAPAQKRPRDDEQPIGSTSGSSVARAGGSGGGSGEGPKSDKSCKQCRQRKTKCTREWPKCGRCLERNLACDFGGLVPVEFVTDMIADNRLASLESRLHSLESSLNRQHRLPLASDLCTAVSTAYLDQTIAGSLMDSPDTDYVEDEVLHALASQGALDRATLERDNGPDGLSWRLARSVMARSLTVHLVKSFFESCCSHLPTFKPWHARLSPICDNLEHLEPATRVAVLAFASMGARASPHSALLHLEFEPSPSPSPISPELGRADGSSPGARREHACRTLQSEAFELNHRLGLENDASIANLEVLVVMAQQAAWNELVPRRSRTLVRLALGHFLDIQDDPAVDDATKGDLVKRLGLPLVAADAMVAAYARKPPLVTRSTLSQAFRGVTIPDLSTTRLTNMTGRFVDLARPGAPVHERIGGFTAMCFVWLIACQRECANLACWRTDPSDGVKALWGALDQLHSCVQRIQDIVIHMDRSPAGCEELDGINDLHLRFATRIHREAQDVTWLSHSLLLELAATDAVADARTMLQESEARVRRSLKLAAFYFELYVQSSDPHQTYHLAFELELVPNWVQLAVQRFGEPGGPASVDLELSETELDLLARGLGVAAFYHCLAERRLSELVLARRPAREQAEPSFARGAMVTMRFNEALKSVIEAVGPDGAWPKAGGGTSMAPHPGKYGQR